MEDPIQDMVSNGYTNLFSSASTYSFSFGGQWGSLDYAFTSDALNDKLSGAAKLHINADEPRALSYSTKFDDAALRDNSFYRSSDHDPLVIGFNLSDESGSTKISALATCAGVTTNDTYFIQVSSLEVGKNYAFDFDKDGKVDEQLVARNSKEQLSTSFTFKNGQVALSVAIDIDFEEGRFSSDVDILVHEIKCIDIDGDGTIDNNVAICNPNATGEKRGNNCPVGAI
jgi:Predicted extracellular nuclease